MMGVVPFFHAIIQMSFTYISGCLFYRTCLEKSPLPFYLVRLILFHIQQRQHLTASFTKFGDANIIAHT